MENSELLLYDSVPALPGPNLMALSYINIKNNANIIRYEF